MNGAQFFHFAYVGFKYLKTSIRKGHIQEGGREMVWKVAKAPKMRFRREKHMI